MHFAKQPNDSSSDDSDDVIPPTPAAKSTPLPVVNRPRKQPSSSSSSSEDDDYPQGTPVFRSVGVKREAETDSSDDEDQLRNNVRNRLVSGRNSERLVHAMSDSDEEAKRTERKQPNSQSESSDESGDNDPPRHIKAVLKTEEASATESSEDEAAQRKSTHLGQNNFSRNNQNAPPSSSDESSEDDQRPAAKPAVSTSQIQQNQRQYKDSSDESSEEDDRPVPKPAPSNLLIQHQRHHKDSSDESSEEDERPVPKPAPSNLTQHQRQRKDSSDESSEEDQKPTLKPVSKQASSASQIQQRQRQYKDSSDESSEEDERPVPKPAPSNLLTQHQRQRKGSSDESSEEDQKPTLKPVSKQASSASQIQQHQRQHKDSSDDSSEEDERPVPKPAPPNHLTQHQRQHKDSSDESSEEDMKPPLKPAPKQAMPLFQQQRQYNDSSEEDENVSLREASKKHVGNQPSSKSSDDSSDEDRTVATKRVFGSQIKPNSTTVYYDSSEPDEEEKAAVLSYEEDYKSKFSQNDASNKTQQLSSEDRKVVPLSAKLGSSLLEETFREIKHKKVHEALSVEDIGSDDEVWLIQCPKSMDISVLKKKNLNLAASSDIQLEDGPTFKRFTVTPHQEVNISINCLLPYQNQNNFHIASFPVKGKVVVQEHVHVPKLRMPEVKPKCPVPFPTGLKVRHPLLGIGFKDHISQAMKTLQENAVNNRKSSKKRKHSAGNVHPLEQHTEDNRFNESLKVSANGKLSKIKDVAPQDESNDEWSRQNKKRKKSLVGDESITSNWGNNTVDGSFLNDTYVKKQKKSKKDKEKDIRKPLQDDRDTSFYDDGSGKKKKRTGAHDTLSSSLDAGHPDKMTKVPNYGQNEKSVREAQAPRLSWHIPQTDEIPVGVLPTDNSSVKIKKKKKHSKDLIDPSDIKQEKDSSVSINGLHSYESSSHSKKRKRKEGDHGSDSLDSGYVPSKKKKHSI